MMQATDLGIPDIYGTHFFSRGSLFLAFQCVLVPANGFALKISMSGLYFIVKACDLIPLLDNRNCCALKFNGFFEPQP
jgi:hypothetical protein